MNVLIKKMCDSACVCISLDTIQKTWESRWYGCYRASSGSSASSAKHFRNIERTHVAGPYYSIGVPIPAMGPIVIEGTSTRVQCTSQYWGVSGSSCTDDFGVERAYIGDNNSCHRSEKDGVTAHKIQKSWCTVKGGEETNIILGMAPPSEDFPWGERPASEKGADNLPTPNVDIAGIHCSQFIPGIQ